MFKYIKKLNLMMNNRTILSIFLLLLIVNNSSAQEPPTIILNGELNENNIILTWNYVPINLNITKTCNPSWSCPDWGTITCKNGFKLRTCNDLNKCGTELTNTKEEKKVCVLDIQEKESATEDKTSELDSAGTVSNAVKNTLTGNAILEKIRISFANLGTFFKKLFGFGTIGTDINYNFQIYKNNTLISEGQSSNYCDINNNCKYEDNNLQPGKYDYFIRVLSNGQTKDSNVKSFTINPPSCNPNWNCPDWNNLECINNQKTRTCTQNNCVYQPKDKIEIQECIIEECVPDLLGNCVAGDNFGTGFINNQQNFSNISIKSNQQDANVYIDLNNDNLFDILEPEFNGTTDFNKIFNITNLFPGNYKIKLNKTDYAENITTISVIAGQTNTIELMLNLITTELPSQINNQQNFSNISIKSNQQDANVYIDLNNDNLFDILEPEFNGTTDFNKIFNITNLFPGNYKIKLNKTDYAENITTISVIAGQTSTVELMLNLITIELANNQQDQQTINLEEEQEVINQITDENKDEEVIGSSNVDSDNDGLPDEWELKYFGNLEQGPDDDFDKDGFTNLQEYLKDTNPKVPNAKQSEVLFGIMIFLIMVGIIGTPITLFVKKRNKRRLIKIQNQFTKPEHRQLYDYVVKARNNKIKEEDINKNLINAGWNIEDVNFVMKIK
jgi:CheY-specific phosphatase CheX